MAYFTIGGRVLVDAGTRDVLVVKPAGLPATPTPGAGGGTTPTPAPTPAVGTITGVAVTSVNGTTARYTWNSYTAAAVTEYSAELRPRGGAAGTSDAWAGIGRWAGPPGSKGGLVDGSAYELRIVAYNGAAVVAVSDPVAFTVGAIAGAGTGAAPPPLPLDGAGWAGKLTAAYSTRRLRSAYAGPCVRVRVEGGAGAVLDVGFTPAGQLDTAALLAALGGATRARVTTWYDQSGNGDHFVQPAAAQQPILVDDGRVVAWGPLGRPGLLGDHAAGCFMTAAEVSPSGTLNASIAGATTPAAKTARGQLLALGAGANAIAVLCESFDGAGLASYYANDFRDYPRPSSPTAGFVAQLAVTSSTWQAGTNGVVGEVKSLGSGVSGTGPMYLFGQPSADPNHSFPGVVSEIVVARDVAAADMDALALDQHAFSGVARAGAGTGGSAGAGATGGTAGGTTTMPPAVATGTFSATYPWHILAGGTDIAVQRVFGNGPGEVPAGSKLTAAVDGTPVVLQDLATATWPDGSRRAGVVSLTLPGARAAGSTADVVFGVTTGAPDATVSKSPAAIAADSDFELRLSGYDLAGDTFVLRVNDVIAANPVFPYGTNPSRMLRVFDAGPERTRLCAEGFVRRATDGAIHRTLKAFVYLDALKSGAYRAIVRWVQDTTYGAFAGGTVGPSGPTRINFVAELYNKGTRVAVWGGPNDPRARTGDGATMLNQGRFIAPAGFNCGYDCGVGVAFSGGNLGGLDGNRVYFPRWSDRGFALDVTRRGDNYPSFGTGGGTVSVFPVMHSFVASGGVGHGIDLHPVWIGPGNKPVVQPGHDRAHLMQRSRMVPPYQIGLQQGKVGGTPRVHTPGEVTMLEIWAIGSASDNPSNPRLGWMGYTHSRIMFTPDDPVLWADMMSQAVSWADFPQQLTDERSGMPPVVNDGPNGDGVTYPGFGPVNPDLENILNGGGGGSPKLGAAQCAGWDKASEHTHGYDDDYQLTNSFAHTPNWWFMPYVLTGDEVWRDLGRANATSAAMLWNHSHGAEGVTYRPIVVGQARGIAWGLRDMSNYVHVSPDSDPYRRVVQDYLKTNFRFYASQTRVGYGRHLGKVYIGESRTSDFCGRPFQDYMFAFALGMLYWRTGDADLRAIMDCFAQYIVRTYDDQYIAGAGWLSNEYGIHANDFDNVTGRGAGLVFDDTAQMLRYSQEPAFDIPQAGPAPYPATGLRRDGNDFGNAEYNYNANSYVAMLLAAQAIWASCGISGPGRVRKQILTRIYGTAKEIPANSRADGLVPQYALTPLPGSPD